MLHSFEKLTFFPQVKIQLGFHSFHFVAIASNVEQILIDFQYSKISKGRHCTFQDLHESSFQRQL